MYIICNLNYAFHYWNNSILVYETLNKFTEIKGVHSIIIELVASRKMNMDSLFDMVCNHFSVDNKDRDIRVAFDNAIEKLIKKKYIIIAQQYIPNTISGKKGYAYPFSILMEITDKCNLMCKHCYRDAKSTQFTDIDLSKFRKICQKFSGKTPNIILTGGEISTHKNIRKIVQYANEAFNVYILSNGSMLSIIPESEIKKIKYAQISTYGYDEKSYFDFTNVRGAIKKFENGIKIIQNAGIDYVVTIMITRKNKNNIEKFIEYLINLDVKAVAFGDCVPLGRAKNDFKDIVLSKKEKEDVFYNIEYLEKQYSDHLSFLPYTGLLVKTNPENNSLDNLQFKCSAGKTNIVIDPRCNVRPCHMIPGTVFCHYSVDTYIDDILNHHMKDYKAEIINYEKELAVEQLSLKNMNCAGFCDI